MALFGPAERDASFAAEGRRNRGCHCRAFYPEERRRTGGAAAAKSRGRNGQDSAGDHVRRLGHPGLAGVAREPAQAVHSADRRSLDLPVDHRRWSGTRRFSSAPVVITNFDYRFRVAEQLKEIERGGDHPARAGAARQRGRGRRGGGLGGGPRSQDDRGGARRRPRVPEREGGSSSCASRRPPRRRPARSSPSASRRIIPRPATDTSTRASRSPRDPKVRRVERFVEKPDEARAKTLHRGGLSLEFRQLRIPRRHHAGGADPIRAQDRRGRPPPRSPLAKEDLGFIVLDRDAFVQAPRTSIDYAVMERTRRAAVLEADVGWSDVGQWSTVWRLSPQDADGNSLRGRAVAIDSSNVLVRSDEHLAAVIGLDNMIVVATGDAVLVADKAQTRQGQAAGRAAEGREPSRGDPAPPHVPSLGLLPEHRPGRALPGQADRREAERPVVAAEALSPRRALDRGARGRRGDVERGRDSSCTKTSRSTCRSAPTTA